MNFDDTTPTEPVDDGASAFDALENLNAFTAAVPEGEYVTIRHEANPPMYVALVEGETSIALGAAIQRRGLFISGAINAYLDGGQITMETVLAPGSVVTLVGSVKGG
jgi:hypothetical protein